MIGVGDCWLCCGQIGAEWKKVVEKICRGHYQPLLLLYQRDHPPLISTHTAPKQTFMVRSFVLSEHSGKCLCFDWTVKKDCLSLVLGIWGIFSTRVPDRYLNGYLFLGSKIKTHPSATPPPGHMEMPLFQTRLWIFCYAAHNYFFILIQQLTA